MVPVLKSLWSPETLINTHQSPDKQFVHDFVHERNILTTIQSIDLYMFVLPITQLKETNYIP